jgi:S-disulfanyl-L-cysteine oxidoreductase SoxD
MGRCSFIGNSVTMFFAGICIVACVSAVTKPSWDVGLLASPVDVVVYDSDILPDGSNLPVGSGTPSRGEVVYIARCQACHGPDGSGGPGGVLIQRESGNLNLDWEHETPINTVWPFSTTLFDYVRRAMPYDAPGVLTSDQLYGILAFLFWRAGLINHDFRLDAESLPSVDLAARKRMVIVR